MRVDTNTKGHRQWFYFSIKSKSKRTIKLNIFRFKKAYSLYQRGMKPYVRSIKNKQEWKPGGFKITYRKQKDNNQYNGQKQQQYYYLTFYYTFQNQQDQVFFAAGIPYTYTYMQTRLLDWQQNLIDKLNFQISNTAKSMVGLNINVIKIVSNKIIQQKNKKIIAINVRTHPGQTSCSWVLDGFIDAICQEKDVVQWINSENIAFHIMPMLNPDGVYVGNYRTGIVGDDFNRKFLSGKRQIFPQIHYLRKMISEAKKQGQLILFLDLHGHSILKNSFIYGPSENQYREYICKKLPNYLWHKSKYFRMSSCRFKDERTKIQTARIYFQQKQNILCFTCQNSLGLYSVNEQTFQMKKQDWRKFGQSIIHSLQILFENQKGKEHKVQTPKINKNQIITEKNLNREKILGLKQGIQIKKTPETSQKIKTNNSMFQTKSKSISQCHQERTTNIFFHSIKNRKNQQQKKNIQIKQRFPSLASKQSKIKQQIPYFSKTLIKHRPSIKKNDQNSFLISEKKKKQESSILKINQSDQKRNIIQNCYHKMNNIKKTSDFTELGKNLIVPQDLKQKVLNKNKHKHKTYNQSKIQSKIDQEPNPFDIKEKTRKPQRSATCDQSYLASQIQKLNKVQVFIPTENIKINSWDRSQSSQIFQNFIDNLSQIYEQSINDSDSQSQNLDQNQRKLLIDCIRANQHMNRQKMLKSFQSSSDQQKKQQFSPQNRKISQKSPTNKRINAFRQIVFKSQNQEYQVSNQGVRQQIGNFKIRKNPYKFKQPFAPQVTKYKSMSKKVEQQQHEQTGLYISQRKQLNERQKTKQRRKQPFVLLSIKEKVQYKN